MISKSAGGCKINWFLKVTGKRPDGYHTLVTLLQYLPFPSDEIELDFSAAPGIRVDCGEGLPQDLDNLAGRAALAYARAAELEPAWHITIRKQVPAAAGLGGGSADAGAVLRLLSRHYGRLDEKALLSLAAKLGADVPFFLAPGLVKAEGIGEKMTPLPPPGRLPEILIVFPGFPVSAKWAYTRLAPERFSPVPSGVPERLADALMRGDAAEIGELMHNDLEYALFEKFPLLGVLREELLGLGAVRVMVSGSGSSLFAIFREPGEKHRAAEKMRELFRGDPEAKVLETGGAAS